MALVFLFSVNTKNKTKHLTENLAQIINGLTLSNFFTRLGIFTISKGQKSTMVSALTRVRQDVVNACSTMRYDAFLADADWDHVITKAHIRNDFTEISKL